MSKTNLAIIQLPPLEDFSPFVAQVVFFFFFFFLINKLLIGKLNENAK